MATPLKGGTYKDEKDLETRLKRRAGSVTKIEVDSPMRVRFLTKPFGKDGWLGYSEHFTDEYKVFPCIGAENDCPGCAEGHNPSARQLANVLDIDGGNRVIALMLPQMLAQSLIKRYKRNGTLLDRDYELTREVDGKKTTYEAQAEAPTKRNIDRYTLLDLRKALFMSASQEFRDTYVDPDDFASDDVEDDEDEDDAPPARRGRVAKKSARAGVRKRRVIEDDDEDEEDDDDEDDAPVRRTAKRAPARRPVKKASGRPVRR